MEEQTNEEKPQAEESMGEDEEEETEELADAEIVELEEGTGDGAQVDVAVNVELGGDTLTSEADAAEGRGIDATKEELAEVGPAESPVPRQASSTGQAVDEDDEEMDQPATAASMDQLDMLEPSSTPTALADLGKDSVASEDEPSRPDTLGADVVAGRDVTDEYPDERAEYADADEMDVLEDEEPAHIISGPYVPGASRFNINHLIFVADANL